MFHDGNYLDRPVNVFMRLYGVSSISNCHTTETKAGPSSSTARTKSTTKTHHLVGSCAMLSAEKGGVVDANLKVYGVEGLRVVDSSAIPLISTANLQATGYAFAERATDLITAAHGLK